MVSLRRRKLLGLCNGVHASENESGSSSPGRVHPIPFDDLNICAEDVIDPMDEIGPTIVTDSSNSKDQHNQSSTSGSNLSKELDSQPTIEFEVKRRKQHRRRRVSPSENCDMRGVYHKNNRWQAAIKVDKKQIHLGTVSSQAEAARLYDRAAFMCGRETNFELTEEEKQQLRKLTWDEFLAKTRNAIINKRTRRGHVTAKAPPSFQNSDWEGEQGAEGSSASDTADLDTSIS